jgi:cyclase
MTYRIIPRLDIKGPNLVKGVHLEGLRVLGKPWDFAQKYYLDGADELIYIDVVASLYGRNNLHEIVQKTAANIFIPLTVGGGVRTVDDIRVLLRAGADKVAINTASIHKPEIIRQSAEIFGSQCIVSYIEAKYINGRYEALTDNGREETGKDVIDWAKQVKDLGAGEILLTSVDKEGTGLGYDLELTQRISEVVSIPVIACGGCGNIKHINEVIRDGKADAVSASSIFHYSHLEESIDFEEYKEEGNIEFISKNRGEASFMKNRISCMNIQLVKKELANSDIPVRYKKVI